MGIDQAKEGSFVGRKVGGDCEGTMKEFKVGDVVRLVSGGPNMTVWASRPDGILDTCWFMGEELIRDAFHPDEVRSVAEEMAARASMERGRIEIEKQFHESTRT